MTDFAALLRALTAAEVRFIVVGGAAATAHGAARLTVDLDIVYERTRENLTRLVIALAELKPYLRGAPPGLPFRFDVETLRHGLNFTLTTAIGDIDLLGEITGGGGYDDLRPYTITLRPSASSACASACIGSFRSNVRPAGPRIGKRSRNWKRSKRRSRRPPPSSIRLGDHRAPVYRCRRSRCISRAVIATA
jgi:hypothetical protein